MWHAVVKIKDISGENIQVSECIVLQKQSLGTRCLCAFCGVFGERNYRCFEDPERTLEELKSFFLQHFISLDSWLCFFFID
jgi:hypothetical protein